MNYRCTSSESFLYDALFEPLGVYASEIYYRAQLGPADYYYLYKQDEETSNWWVSTELGSQIGWLNEVSGTPNGDYVSTTTITIEEDTEMATPTLLTRGVKRKVWGLIVKSMGFKSVEDIIDRITICAGTPTAELTGMKDYSFVWDSTNKIAYFHTTAATFVQIGQAVTFRGGHKLNANAQS